MVRLESCGALVRGIKAQTRRSQCFGNILKDGMIYYRYLNSELKQ
jgi:hypothetical protein